MKYKLYEYIYLKNQALHEQVRKALMQQEQDKILLLPLQSYLCNRSLQELEQLTYPALFKKVHPLKKYTEGYQRQLMVMLQDYYERALYQMNIPADRLTLARLLRESTLTKNYNTLIKEIETDLWKHQYKDDIFLTEMQFYNEKINQSIFLEKMTLTDLKSLTIKIDTALDHHYILQKIKNILSLHNIDRTYPLPSIQYYTEIEAFIESDDSDLSDILYLYKHCYKLQIHNSEPSFEIIQHILFEKHHLMMAKERKDLSAMLSNFCIKKINGQQFEYYEALMRLYKFNVSNNIILENNILLSSTFRNYVQIALRCNEIAWAHELIESHQQYLKPGERESTVSICEALLFFKENKFEKTIHALTQVNFHDYQLDILARLLLARAYYELDETETLGYLIDSFKKYLQRNKRIDIRLIVPCKNFLKLLSAILQLNPRDKNKIQKIKTTIQEHPQLAEKQWLIEKINEF